ncbi:protein-lysine N-methyltransferase EEF2KMT [Leptopilina heterotoma]|uniref:protein-lysine N-methyltransferase EEF2KMT n=1 Tax=Leptopilina heterotoma TaxID=63436 RepID=UPI001CA8F5C0|nr:protein-lysine N-methyltransferase EEF2KMT [Leptopilina heterotoma]
MDSDDISIDYIKKQFFSCIPLKKFDFMSFEKNGFKIENICVQEKIFDNTVNNEIVRKYPLKKSYLKAFLKLLIDKLEENNDEVDNKLYDEYCKLISSKDEESSTHYRHFLIEKNICITLEESTSIISQGTTGLCTWQAASKLAEWCLMNKSDLINKKILELGSGIGLTGLTVINTCSPKQYTFSDCHPIVMNLLFKNLMTNFSNKENFEKLSNQEKSDKRFEFEGKYNQQTEVRAVNLKWEEMNNYLIDLIDNNDEEPEIVIAADVLYDSSNFSSLSNALKILLIHNQCHYAIIAATVRNSKTIDQFLEQLDKNLSYSDEIVPKSIIFIPTDDTPIRIIKKQHSTKGLSVRE